MYLLGMRQSLGILAAPMGRRKVIPGLEFINRASLEAAVGQDMPGSAVGPLEAGPERSRQLVSQFLISPWLPRNWRLEPFAHRMTKG
jgi:hypothetical protein